MAELIEYALQLPPGRPGELVGKLVSRILKHSFNAKHVRVQLFNNVRRVTARIEKRHLESIRGAVKMAMQAKGLAGPLVRDPKTMGKFEGLPLTPFRRLKLDAGKERSAETGDGDRGAPSGEALQEKSQPAPDDAPTAA